jgi:hypothetical protein
MTNTLKLLALLGVSPTSRCIFVRVRRKIQCLLFFSLFFSHFRALFSPEHFSLCSGFRCLSANFSPIFCWRFFFFSKEILSLFGAVIAQFGRQFDENIITVKAKLNFLGQFVELKYFIAIQSLSALRIDESNVNAL